jgi:Glycosyltransferase
MQRAKAFVFAAEEDFGIAPVEAQACGTPVICYGFGGTKETVLDKKTGIYFLDQNVNSIIEAINTFEKLQDTFDPQTIRQNALRFSRDRFEKEIKTFVEEAYDDFKSTKN